ncbi:ATP-binding protein [Microvirga solisilvae]|uniref:ATP-binding protein n=1 Tax=Microvirga solisilvae TaxID=2919498 RepID=UPI001FAEB371|nr:ATP-binding protein [Microvirga solisilvae]
MRTSKISEADALTLSNRSEDHFFDRKAAKISGKKLQKIVVAFANADGGEVVVGIADDGDEPNPANRWQGLGTVEDYNGLLQALFSLNPAVDVRYEFLECDTKPGYVLRMFVERGADVNKTDDGSVYQRFGAQSLPLNTPQKVNELAFAKGAQSFENMKVSGLPPEVVVDSNEIREFLRGYSPATDPLDFVVNQHLVDLRDWTPSVAGILLFANNPPVVMPRKCSVRISRYETREDEPERDHLKESYIIEGPLYKLIHASVDKITEILSGLKQWTEEGMKEIKYPPEAIWEVFVNAVIHRDYSISDDVQVLIFNDRVEISSPGRLPGYVKVDNILDARFSRNSKIVRCLARYPVPPNKDMGEGLNTVFQKMKEWKLKPPQIQEDGNYVKVVIRHAPLALPTEAIMNFLAHHEEITNAQARELTGIKSENLVKVEFYKLRDQGLIERVPGKQASASAWRKVAAKPEGV